MSVGQEEGNDISSSLPSRTANVLTDHLSWRGQILKTEWSLNPTIADRILCLGQTIHGSVRPGENTKLAMHISCSGGDGVESGQSCPDLGRPVCLCVPTDKPDNGMYKQGQNRKCRDLPNRARLAKPGMFPGPLDLTITFH